MSNEIAAAIAYALLQSAPQKQPHGSRARRQWLADVMAVQMALLEADPAGSEAYGNVMKGLDADAGVGALAGSDDVRPGGGLVSGERSSGDEPADA